MPLIPALIFLNILITNCAVCQPFEKINLSFPGLSHSKINWIDLNNDRLLDVFISGVDDSVTAKSQVYINHGGGNFVLINSGLPNITNASIAWADFDKDGDLDLLVSAYSSGHNGIVTRIYENLLPASFAERDFGFADLHSGSVKWIDYNNDSHPDVFITGLDSGGSPQLKLYKNTGNSFSEIQTGLPSVYFSSCEFYDFDKDGDADLLISGQTNENKNSYLTEIFINDNSSFTESGIELPPMSKSSSAWGDFDSDGYGDIVMQGEMFNSSTGNTEFTTAIFRNNGDNTFSKHASGLPGLSSGNILWADFDNDGFLDILAVGNHSGNATGIAGVYRNNNGNFTEVKTVHPDLTYGQVSIGDFDNDFRIDILLTGHNPSTKKNITYVYRNLTSVINEAPVEPKGLTTTFDNAVIHFNWLEGTDSSTPSAGLSYNLRIGTFPGGDDILSPAGSGVNGFSRLPGTGNTGAGRSWHIEGLEPGLYYWSVQTVDNTFNTSEYTADNTFTFQNPLPGSGNPSTGNTNGYILMQNFPNPFNPFTNIKYEIPNEAVVIIKIFDTNGRLIDTPVNEYKQAGSYSFIFSGENLSSGIYYYKIEAAGFSLTKKMVMLR